MDNEIGMCITLLNEINLEGAFQYEGGRGASLKFS